MQDVRTSIVLILILTRSSFITVSVWCIQTWAFPSREDMLIKHYVVCSEQFLKFLGADTNFHFSSLTNKSELTEHLTTQLQSVKSCLLIMQLMFLLVLMNSVVAVFFSVLIFFSLIEHLCMLFK